MADHAPKLGVFGGTFNPIHTAHLRLAEDVLEEFSLERVLFIPTNLPPHKKVQGLPAPVHRLRMIRLAVQNNPAFGWDDTELDRGGVSYTIDTVEYLYDRYGLTDKPYYIIGSDLARDIHTWKDIGELVHKVRFIVLTREGYPVVENRFLPKSGLGRSWFCFEKRRIDVTSSEIRDRVTQGKSIRYLVPDMVLEYIRENRLYEYGL